MQRAGDRNAGSIAVLCEHGQRAEDHCGAEQASMEEALRRHGLLELWPIFNGYEGDANEE